METLSYYPDLERNYKEEQERLRATYDISSYRLLEPGETQYSSEEEEDD